MKRATCIPWIAMVAMMALSIGSDNVACGQTVDHDNWTVQSPYSTQRQSSKPLNLPYIGPSLSTRRSSAPARAPQFMGKTFDYDWNTSAITVSPFTNDQVSTLSERHAWFMPGSNLLRGAQQNTALGGTGDTTGTQTGAIGGGIIGGLFGLDADQDGAASTHYQWAVRSAQTPESGKASANRPAAGAGQLPARQWRPPSGRRVILPFGGELKQGEYSF